MLSCGAAGDVEVRYALLGALNIRTGVVLQTMDDVALVAEGVQYIAIALGKNHIAGHAIR